jgi:O-antigen ligase
MKINSKVFLQLLVYAACFISATAVSNPASDMFQISGSLKISDIILIFPIFVFLSSSKFIETILVAIRISPGVSILFFLFVVFSLISMLANIDLFGLRMVMHILRLLYYILVVFAFAHLVRLFLSQRQILSAMYFGSVYMSVYILCRIFVFGEGFRYGNGQVKLDSSLGANPVSSYAALFFVVGLVFLKNVKSRFLKIVNLAGIMALGTVSLLSESKASWVIIIVSVVIYLIFLPAKQKVSIIFVGLLLVLSQFNTIYEIVALELRTSNSNTSQRFDMLVAAYRYFENNPFFGIGSSNFVLISPYGTEPHSAYALILAETGIFGFLCFVLLLLSMWMYALRQRYNEEMFLFFLMIGNVMISCAFSGLLSTQLTLFAFIGIYLGQKINISGQVRNNPRK